MEFKEVISDIKIFSRKNSDYRVLLNRRHLFGLENKNINDRELIKHFILRSHPRPKKVITEYSVFKRVGGSYRYVPYMRMIFLSEYRLIMIILRNKYEVEIKTVEQPKPTILKSSGNTSTTTSDYSYSLSSTTTNI